MQIMEVVKSNFLKVLPLIENAIEKSLFIAIDTEFTGLSVLPSEKPSPFDSMKDRYRKLRDTATHFTVCQFGLSAYLKDPLVINGYVAHSFNFYLFPRDIGNHQPRFAIQASNMDFLCKHNFDFNKWIYEGISFCNANQEEGIAIASEAKTSEWIEMVGFRHIFNLLVKVKKPIIGHNMLQDLAYILDMFHNPLPSSYEEFKRTVHQLFPLVIDTKNICFAVRKGLGNPQYLNSTKLEDVYDSVQSQDFSQATLYTPQIRHSDDTLDYVKGERFHEAGFDAYCTGFVFLRLAHRVCIQGISSSAATPPHFNDYLRTLHPYINKVNLTSGPIKFINLVGKDHKQCKGVQLIVKHRNDTGLLNIDKITKEMYEFGPLEVQSIQPDKAVIAIQSSLKADKLLKHFSNNPTYEITRYRGVIPRTLKFVVLPIGALLLVLSFFYFLC